MKKNRFYSKLILSFLMIFLAYASYGQQYLSKPEVIKNLADESKKLNQTMESTHESNLSLYNVSAQKQSVIKKILKQIKLGKSVGEAVDSILGTGSPNEFVSAVGSIDYPSGYSSAQDYIRQEILFLISY
ncbi:MAG TPA: hypothetical protein P5235_11140 [Saprospiraceae bacterium]|nr:hypothetical protein [Saprospiraceae bacterium]